MFDGWWWSRKPHERKPDQEGFDMTEKVGFRSVVSMVNPQSIGLQQLEPLHIEAHDDCDQLLTAMSRTGSLGGLSGCTC